MMRACFHSFGTSPYFNEALNINSSAGKISVANSIRNFALIPSGLLALNGFNDQINYRIPFADMVKSLIE